MTASCFRDFEGLLAGHVYTVIGVYELISPEGNIDAQLLKLRNPLSQQTQFTGAWNIKDERWKKYSQSLND